MHQSVATATAARVELHFKAGLSRVVLPGRKDERLAIKVVARDGVVQAHLHRITCATLRKAGNLPRMTSGVTSLPMRVDPSG